MISPGLPCQAFYARRNIVIFLVKWFDLYDCLRYNSYSNGNITLKVKLWVPRYIAARVQVYE